MQKTIRYSIALLVGLLVCIHGNAAVIDHAVVDGNQLTITGTALRGLAGTVTFDGQATTNGKDTDIQIVVTLKSAPAQGNYRVTVGRRPNQITAFVFVSDLKAERWDPITFQCGKSDGVCNLIRGAVLAPDAELVLLREIQTNSGSYTVVGDGGNATISLGGHTYTLSLNKGRLGLPNQGTEKCINCGPFTLAAIVLRQATPRVMITTPPQ